MKFLKVWLPCSNAVKIVTVTKGTTVDVRVVFTGVIVVVSVVTISSGVSTISGDMTLNTQNAGL